MIFARIVVPRAPKGTLPVEGGKGEGMQITVTQAPENRRRRKPESGEALGFGNLFSDHMFLMEYSQGTGWRDARIVPYGPLSLDPSAMVLHYGQEIFEGMKAYYARDGGVCLFRPDRNAERLNRSAARMCMPEIPVEDQLAALRALVRLDREWIPRGDGASLYIRPDDDRDRGGAGRPPVGGCPLLHHHRPGGGVLRPGVRARPHPRRGEVRARRQRGRWEKRRRAEITRRASSRRRTRRRRGSTRSSGSTPSGAASWKRWGR